MVFWFLILFFHEITCWSPTEQLNEYDKTIMQIFNKPRERDKAKLLETLLSFIKAIVTATHELKTNNKIFDDCKKLYSQKDWMDFIYFEWDKKLTKNFKDKLNFAKTEYQEYKALMRNSVAAWMQFLDAVELKKTENHER